jgi:hypothetical protein
MTHGKQTKLVFIASLLQFQSYLLFAQQNNGLYSLINTEKSFAYTAIEKNTKLAFLTFLDSSGVVFNNGQAKNGIEVWSLRQAPANKLFWSPVYAAIAASNDIGFTSGPWQLKTANHHDSILASGYFATLWQRNKSNEWKVIADLGISCQTLLDTSKIKTWKGKKYFTEVKSIDIIDKDLNLSTIRNTSAFKKVLQDNSWFLIPGHQPFKGKKEILQNGTALLPNELSFIPLKSGVSAAKDLFYVYGITLSNNKKGNYLRVWEMTKRHPKLLLQVINN